MALQDTDLLLVQRSSASYKMPASELSTYVGGGNSSVTVSATAPSTPENGDMWWNSGDGNLYIYYTDADSSQWVPSNSEGGGFANATVGPNVPSAANEGDLWFSTGDARLYIYDGTFWIDAAPASQPNVSTISATAPSTPTTGDLWYDLDSARLYIYTGSQWVDSAPGYGIQDGAVGSQQLANDAVTAAKVDASALAKNVIINGMMQVVQRGPADLTSSGYAGNDRWRTTISGYDLEVNSLSLGTESLPFKDGFSNSQRIRPNTGKAPAAGEYAIIEQKIEGVNLQQFAKGTSEAKPFSLSFWVKATVAGTYIAELSSNTRSCSLSYTISTNDWNKVELVFPADTSGSVISNDSNSGLTLSLWLAAGTDYSTGTLQTTWGDEVNANRAVDQVNSLATTNNEFSITGVQLTATPAPLPFQHEDYGTTLSKCQRYYQIIGNSLNAIIWGGYGQLGNPGYFSVYLPSSMRIPPTVTKVGTWYTLNISQPTVAGATESIVSLAFTTTGTGGQTLASGGGNYLIVDAEL